MYKKNNIAFVAIVVIGCLFLTTTFSGCLLVPFIEGASKMGATKADREELLVSAVKKFQDAIYWGDTSKAMSFSLPESKDDIYRKISDLPKTAKLVESKISYSNFDESSYNADVKLITKSYDTSTLIIKELVEDQKWVFSYSDGWKISSITKIPS